MKKRLLIGVAVALGTQFVPGAARALTIQYDFLATASIAVNGGGPTSVNNAALSFTVDWTTIDSGGPVTTATGAITSISAFIAPNASGLESALLNDTTSSALSPYFNFLGFGTTDVAAARDEMLALGTTFSSYGNEISALDPFSLNPIFSGSFLDTSATREDFDLLTVLDRNYGFHLTADGSAGYYSFSEEMSSTFLDLLLGADGTESGSIHYEFAQLISATGTPVPEPASVLILGLGIAGLAVRRSKK